MKRREQACLWIARAMALAALLALAWRVRRGIDYTDDAFYLALPMRIALGDSPFVDELNIAQTAGLLLVPFVKLWMMVRGTNGIFLFVRILFLLFFGGVGWTAYAMAKKVLPRHGALLASAVSITFLPHGIPGLSYNTLGSGLLAIGLFLVARALLDPPERVPSIWADRFTWAGLALGAASFAYPTLLSSAVIATLCTFALASGRRVTAAGRMALGGCAFAALVVPLFVLAGRHNLNEMLRYSAAGLVTGDKVRWLMDESFGRRTEWPLLFVATAVAVALARKAPRLFALALPLLPLLAKGGTVFDRTHVSIAFVTSLALLGPLVALALRDSRAARTLVVAVWLPSACAGAAMAWVSSNGFVAAGSGLFPAAIVSTVMLAMWTGELARSFHRSGVRVVLGFAPVVVLFTMVKLALAPDSIYRDGNIPQLTAPAPEGPYSGLLTTPERQRSLAKMSADIRARAKTSRALFYYDFAAGYLIAARRPLVATSWIFPREPSTTMDSARFLRNASRGDLVVRLGRVEDMNAAGNALDRAVKERCDLQDGAADGYTVWVVR